MLNCSKDNKYFRNPLKLYKELQEVVPAIPLHVYAMSNNNIIISVYE